MTKPYCANRFMVYCATKALLAELGEMPACTAVAEYTRERYGGKVPSDLAYYHMRGLHEAGKLPAPRTLKSPMTDKQRESREINLAYGRSRYTADPYCAPVDRLIGAG